ncbi:kinase-like domain-containing protein [Rhizophagus irregularis DAOM 181602=DAOM 197198]|nr:kinase-like domain-containing protein [Rhizophagus irregularis DAOM 181602=DAOM 197198]
MNQTPEEYLKLYKLCWNPDPDVRTPINKIFTKLGKMSGIQDTSYDDNVINIMKNKNFFYQKTKKVSKRIKKFVVNLFLILDSNNEQTNNNISSVISNDGFGSLFSNS